MLRSAANWMRQHPIRCVVYALLIAAAAWTGLTIRGILRGERNGLLTDVARAPLLRDFVAREFHIRYAIESVALTPTCRYQIEVRGANVQLEGGAAGGIDSARVCLTGSGEVHGIRVGGGLISVGDVQFDWPKSVSGSGVSWRDANGEMVSAAAFTAAPGDLSGSIQSLRLLTIATVDSASAALAPLALPALTVKNAAASGISVDADMAAIQQAQTRFQAAAAALQAMGNSATPLPPQWSATARRLLTDLLIAAAIVLLALKALLTRAPASVGWRIPVILAPFAVAALIALTDSWLSIVIAAPVLAIVLWAVAYRRAPQWQQRWEPAAIDIPSVLLALLLLVLRNWPAVALPPIPAIDRVTLAQANIQNIAATVHPPNCGASGTVRVTVPQAALANLNVTLNGSALKTIDLERASASGSVQTSGIPDLQRIRYLPPQWKQNAPIAFCTAVTLRNSGAAPMPEMQCTGASGVVARAAVDYTGQSARFAAEWNGAPAPLSLSGSATLTGAQIDDLHTKPSAAVHIDKASARISWPNRIAAGVTIDSIQASGATISRLVADAGIPMPCTSGPVTVTGKLAAVNYSSGGNDIRMDGAAFSLARPSSAALSATVHTGQIAVNGPVALTLPESDFRFDGVTSRELIPQSLDALALFHTSGLSFSAPTRITANLWTGDWQLPQQSLTMRQDITSWIPASIGFELEGSGAIASLSTPLQASARGRLRIPHLAPQFGPTDIELNDLAVAESWSTASGLAPAAISSGWNVVRIPTVPTGFQLNEISSFRLSTSGKALEAPSYTAPPLNIPTIPEQTRFQFQGTPESLTVSFEGGEQITVDAVKTSNLKVSMPDFKLTSVDVDTSALIVRPQARFPVAAHTHLSSSGVDAGLTAPLFAKFSAGTQAVSFALTRPLDTARLLAETGLALNGVQPQATLSSLQANVGFAGARIASLDVSGVVASGPLATAGTLTVSQTAPSQFHLAAPEFPKVAVSASAPGVEVALNGDKLRLSAATDVALKFTLASAPPSPLFNQLTDAATGLFHHAQKATQVFGAENASAFPLDWNVDITGGAPTVLLTPDRIAINASTALKSVDIGQTFLDGSLDLHAGARLAQDHLLIDLDAPGEIGAFGRRWQLDTPLLLALRSQLLPGTGGALFDSAFYAHLGGSDPFHIAIGYGDALQFNAEFHQPFTSGSIEGLTQAAVSWPNNAASIDSFGTFQFRGLEAGALTLAQPYLEDRLDGDIRFSTKGFFADRLLLPQLLSDASRVRQLDTIDLSAQVRSAADGLHLPGIVQASTALSLKPANDFLRLITSGLNLTLPPSALQYRNMALDFRVQHGLIQTEPVLLTLNGVQVPGLQGLTLDSRVRVMWGGRGYEPAPRLRDLIYTLQRSLEP